MMQKKPVFKDPALQEKYLQQGYVILPALEPDKVKEMIQLHDLTHPNVDELPNCYNTSDHALSIEAKRKVSEEIAKVLQPLFKNYLNDFKGIYFNYIGKKPGDNSIRYLHQDYSFCDESKYNGYNIWIPLHDITKENSYFSIVRNSYQFFHSYRGRQLRHKFEANTNKIMDNICTDLFPKAGEALIYNTASLHHTPLNVSNASRIAISVMSIPQEAKVSLYQPSEEKKGYVERYEVDEEFLLEYPTWERIEGLDYVELVPYDEKEVSWSELENAYYQYNKDVKRPTFWNQLFKRK
ncbi:MAG: phytanoyl-CoA dioxygenase family protein [Chitinophagales bacterium]|nr:phytanoyl-CoA dioxygenase family protein [Chitinophagales bacterium]